MPISEAITAKAVMSTGISSVRRDAKRRLVRSRAASMMPVRRSTMNVPPMTNVKNTTSEASTSPRGIAVTKSTREVGEDSTAP